MMPRLFLLFRIFLVLITSYACTKSSESNKRNKSSLDVVAEADAEISSAGQATSSGAEDLALMHAKVVSCSPCHAADRPAAPHEAQSDCIGCHSFPSFKAKLSSFNHNPPPVSCVGCHEKDRPGAPHIAKNDCASCHAFPTFKRAAFSHSPKLALCEDCHTRPTTTGLRAYPNQGPPIGFNPNDAATLGGKHYVGKDCGSCHLTPDEGATAFAFTHSKPKADFCLPCHFNQGRGEHANDNDVMLNAFGNCASCHPNFDKAVNRSFDGDD